MVSQHVLFCMQGIGTRSHMSCRARMSRIQMPASLEHERFQVGQQQFMHAPAREPASDDMMACLT